MKIVGKHPSPAGEDETLLVRLAMLEHYYSGPFNFNKYRVNINDLFEARLPLLPNELNRARGSYAAFVVTMHPEDFLKLTASPDDRERIEATPFPKDEHDTPGRFPMPFLNVYWPSGKISGHEGRHRALMVSRQGGKSFPVIIYLRHQMIYTVTYSREDEETGDWTDHSETFDDMSEAQARRDQLAANTEDNVYYWRVKLNYRGGDAIKGSPVHQDPNDPWKRKAFRVDEMPKQLIAQYDDSIRVSSFRVGLVKGYTHFRESVELDEKTYREHVRKPLTMLTVDDVKLAMEHNPDGIVEAFIEMLVDWAEFDPALSQEQLIEKELQRSIDWLQREFAAKIQNGRLPIYREVNIKDEHSLRRDDLGASWTPNPNSAHSYNGSMKEGPPHLITAWVADENVDWAATLMMRVHNSNEDEVRIYSSEDVHVLGVDPR